MSSDFKRDFYHRINDCFNRTNVIFLLGPRKCGKTYCLKQLENNIANTRYIDFKMYNEYQSMDLFDSIVNSIQKDEAIIYLLDEITYAFMPEREIEKIANTLSVSDNDNTKIVFTGSQSVALKSWGHRSFAGNAEFIETNFLTFPEWLDYVKRNDISEESYLDFLYDVDKFYKFSSLKGYLEGCLDETVISNSKTNNILFNNDCSLIDAEILLDVLYSTLISLHNSPNAQTFSNRNQLKSEIKYYFRDVLSGNSSLNEDVSERVSSILMTRYNSLKAANADTLKQALIFLLKCDLITLTPRTASEDKAINVLKDIMSDDSHINYKTDLFLGINACIKYPMFYIAILKDIFREQMPARDNFPRQLLGGIVECHARGILPEKDCYEYHDENDNEVDYVNFAQKYSVEFTVSNKRLKETPFDCLPDDYEHILFTHDTKSVNNGITRIPYYEFIYNKSVDILLGQELKKDTTEQRRHIKSFEQKQ